MIKFNSPLIGNEEKIAILDVIDKGVLYSSEKTIETEILLSNLFNTKLTILYPTPLVGADIIAKFFTMFKNYIPNESEVIISPFISPYLRLALYFNKFKMVCIDVDKETFNIDINQLKNKINKNTLFVITNNTFGVPFDNKIYENLYFEKNPIPLVEDATQSLGSAAITKCGKRGSISFYNFENDIVSAGGSLCAVTIQIEQAMNFFNVNRQHINEIQTAILGWQLKKINYFINKRNINENIYIKNLCNNELITYQKKEEGIGFKYNSFGFPIKVPNQVVKQLIVQKLIEMEIETLFINIFDNKEILQNAEEINNTVIVLPTNPDITEKKIEIICSVIKKIVGNEYG